MKKKKFKLPKYATGTPIRDYMTDPSTAISQNQINIAQAQYEAESNPWVKGLQTAGNVAMGVGVSQGGLKTIPGKGGEEIMSEDQGNLMNSLLPLLGNMQFGYGGEVPQTPVEVEGKEVGELPNGNMVEFEGASHEQGGIPTTLPVGTEMFSNRIKVKGKTMAERKKAREKKELSLSSLLEKNPSDKLTKGSLEKTQKNNKIEEEFDTNIQELLTGLIGMGQKMAYGGPVEPLDQNAWLKSFNIPSSYENLTNQGLWDSKYGQKYEEYLGGFQNPALQPPVPITDPSYFTTPESAGNVVPSTPEVPGETKSSILDNININEATPGDMVGLAGNMVSSVTPYLSVLKNRGGDTPNPNYFEGFGEDALAKMGETKQYVESQKAENLNRLQSSKNAAMKRGRNSARGVNTMRALDLATDNQANQQEGQIYSNFAQQMMSILGGEAQLENMQDQAVMQGKEKQDVSDRMDKDNFDTQMSRALAGLGYGLQETGKDLNSMKTNQTVMNLLNQLSKYGITIDNSGNLTTE